MYIYLIFSVFYFTSIALCNIVILNYYIQWTQVQSHIKEYNISLSKGSFYESSLYENNANTSS